jgi:hypothetical protein
MSVVSETDRVLFTILSNPERVDLAALPEARVPEDRVEDITPPEEDHYASAPPPEEGRRAAEEDPYAPPPEEGRRAAEEDHYATPLEEGRRAAEEDHYASAPAPLPASLPERADENHYAPAPPPPPEVPPPSPEDTEDAKRTLLLDLRRLEMQGIRLTKEWTMDDRLDDMMLEMRRHTLAMDEQANVNMMRDGMRLLVTGIEMVNNRFGLLDLEGWSSEVCRDLHKHDANLSRIYRKYWRRSTSTSPEVDICMSLVGSMGLHHMKRKMSKQMMTGSSSGFSAFSRPPPRGGGGSGGKKRAPTPPSSDDEGPP